MLPIDKWACPSIEIEIHAAGFSSGMHMQEYRYRLDCLQQQYSVIYRSLYINYMGKSFSGREIGAIDVTMPWLHD